PEPNCMASLIAAEVDVSGTRKKVLFFSNPADKNSRVNLTIKASLDEGKSWPSDYHFPVRQEEGYGYSCLTMIDDNSIGILFEGRGDLIFRKVLLNDILKNSR
ncbi:MAG: glycoside hydrolase, partial [Ignavibacteria bacterium]|nr:glycoside hydrolase [Ignavibacteria bacterium]